MALHSQSSNSQKACISIHHGSLLLDRWCLGDWVSCSQGGNTAPWHQKVVISFHNILQYTVCWLSDTSPQAASTWWPPSWCRTPWSSTTTSWWARWSPGRGWRRPCRGGRPGAGSTAATTPCTTLSAPLRTLGTNPSWPLLTTPSNWTTSEERDVKCAVCNWSFGCWKWSFVKLDWCLIIFYCLILPLWWDISKYTQSQLTYLIFEKLNVVKSSKTTR